MKLKMCYETILYLKKINQVGRCVYVCMCNYFHIFVFERAGKIIGILNTSYFFHCSSFYTDFYFYYIILNIV